MAGLSKVQVESAERIFSLLQVRSAIGPHKTCREGFHAKRAAGLHRLRWCSFEQACCCGVAVSIMLSAPPAAQHAAWALSPLQPGHTTARHGRGLVLSSASQHTHDKRVLQEGNSRRKTESTDANAASSRSHAILEVTVCRSDRNHYQKQVQTAFTLATTVMLWLPQPQGLPLAKACCSQSINSLLQHKQLCLFSPKHACLFDRRLMLQHETMQRMPPQPAMHIIKLSVQVNSST